MQYVVLVAMAVFFGFAFEQFYGQELQRSPGGVRAFPLLSFLGAALLLIDPLHFVAFTAALLILGLWLVFDVRERLRADDPGHGYLMVPVCTIAAYALGGVAMTQPAWLTVGLTVAAVLLIGSRARLHAITETVPFEEVVTLAQFLLLVGVALPLLYPLPAIPFTTLTPFKVWLGVVAVSTISYASYLLDRYVFRRRGTIVSALLGGMYSSTVTTVVFARNARLNGYSKQLAAGTVIATAVMYVRLLVETSIFNLHIARGLLLPFVSLTLMAFVLAALAARLCPPGNAEDHQHANPLALGTALGFAVLLILFSQLSTWATTQLGTAGLLEIAALVGLTEIDPFVIGVAQSHVIPLAAGTAAVVMAASSNNVMKAVLAATISARRESVVPVAALATLAAAGGVFCWVILR